MLGEAITFHINTPVVFFVPLFVLSGVFWQTDSASIISLRGLTSASSEI